MRSVLFYAKVGNIRRLRKILEEKPQEREYFDNKLWTPLFYAAHYNKTKAVRYLISKGADRHVYDHNYRNLVEVAKQANRHTSTSRYLKKKLGFSVAEKSTLHHNIRTILSEELSNAKKQNKKLLILLGEVHSFFKIYQLEKIFLEVLKELKIVDLYIEDDEISDYLYPIDFVASHKLKMRLHPIDKHPDRENASMVARDRVMSYHINAIKQAGAVIVGAGHLKGLLKRINTTQYHVLPFNLSGCLEKDYLSDNMRSRFANNEKKVVQFKKSGFFQVKKISDNLNKPTLKIKLK